MAFNFTPENGLLDTVTFPDNPATSSEARQQFMTLFNQIKEYLNANTNTGVKGDSWWIKDGATGLIKQGGRITINFQNQIFANGSQTFPIPFPTKVLTITANETSNSITNAGMFNVAVNRNGLTGIIAQAIVLDLNNRTGTVVVDWEATGY